MIVHDDGFGTTQRSLDCFKQFMARYGNTFEPHGVYLDRSMRTFGMEIDGTVIDPKTGNTESVCVLLSGVNCGYGGEGPHGSVEVMKQLLQHLDYRGAEYLEERMKPIEVAIFKNNYVHFNLRNDGGVDIIVEERA